MNQCIFDGQEADWSLLSVDEMSFGSDKWDNAKLPYTLILEGAYIVERFSEYYDDFVERERSANLDDEPLSGEFLELYSLNYPPLEILYHQYSNLFSRLILRVLKNAFMGYMITPSPLPSQKYILQTLDDLEVKNGVAVMHGFGLLNPMAGDLFQSTQKAN